MRPTGYPLRVGADTLVMYIPCTTDWRVPNVRAGKDKRMAVYGDDWHLYHVYTPGGTYWRLTVHSRDHGRQLLTADSLLPRLIKIFRAINLPPHLRYAICDGQIGFVRVDIATDFSCPGYIPLEPDEVALCASGRRTIEIYEGEQSDSLYIRMPGGSVRQCRYDKSVLWRARGLPRRYWRVPTSRVEYRFQNADHCRRAGVRTLSGLLSVLSGWKATLADNRRLWRELYARPRQEQERAKKKRTGESNNQPPRSCLPVLCRAYNNTPFILAPAVNPVGRRPHAIPPAHKYPKFKLGRSPPACFPSTIR